MRMMGSSATKEQASRPARPDCGAPPLAAPLSLTSGPHLPLTRRATRHVAHSCRQLRFGTLLRIAAFPWQAIRRDRDLIPSRANAPQVKSMIASVDDDGNGTVEFEEFLVIMARRILMHEGAMELEAVRPPNLPASATPSAPPSLSTGRMSVSATRSMCIPSLMCPHRAAGP